jgi:hypothetical protein
VSSVCNSGLGLSTAAGAPGDSVGAYVSPAMAPSAHYVVEPH